MRSLIQKSVVVQDYWLEATCISKNIWRLLTKVTSGFFRRCCVSVSHYRYVKLVNIYPSALQREKNKMARAHWSALQREKNDARAITTLPITYKNVHTIHKTPHLQNLSKTYYWCKIEVRIDTLEHNGGIMYVYVHFSTLYRFRRASCYSFFTSKWSWDTPACYFSPSKVLLDGLKYI